MRPHWWTMVAPTSFVLLLLAGVIIAVAIGNGNVFGQAVAAALGLVFFVGLLFLGISYLRWNTTNFVVTNERIIYRYGIIGKNAKEMPLDRVTNIAFNQTAFERVIGSGDLTIESAGETGQETFHNIRRPNLIHNEIYRQMELLEERDARRQAGMMGKAAGFSMGNSVPDQIAQLHDLKERGLLSEEEFQQKKRDLLNRM